MMQKVVLPTGEIISNFRHLEEMFSFHEDGLAGLVRDMVLTADSPEVLKPQVREAFKQALRSTGLIEKVMRDYAQSPEAQFNLKVGNTWQEHAVEMAAECIYQTVLEMMSALFMRAVFEICKQEWDWVGTDLIAKVDVLDRGDGNGS